MKKRMVMALAICLAAGLFAACGRTDVPTPSETVCSTASVTVEEPTAGEVMTVETAEASAHEKTTTEPQTFAQPLVMTPAKPFDPADRLEPTQEDLDRLCGLVNWGRFFGEDYDSDSTCVLDYIADEGGVSAGLGACDLLREGENFAYYDGMDEDVMHIGSDPRGYAPYGGYKKIRADVMEYYLENVLHNFTYRDSLGHHESSTLDNGAEWTEWDYYCEDGWYYFSWKGCCNENVPLVRDYKVRENGHYTLTVDLVDCVTRNSDVIYATIQVDATLIQKDGRRLWTIYNSKVVYDRSAEA